MSRFRSLKTQQNCSAVHAQAHNHFYQERHLIKRTLARVGGVARTRGVDRRLWAGMSRHAQTTAFTLTKPVDIMDVGYAWAYLAMLFAKRVTGELVYLDGANLIG
jgi:hypothetical protein